MSEEENGGPRGTDREEGVDARREALRKLGLFGAVTAPALIAMLQSERAQAASPIGEPINGMCTVDPPDCTFW